MAILLAFLLVLTSLGPQPKPRLDLRSGLTFIVLQVDAQSTSTSQKMKSVFYVSTKYGFRFLLPDSWKGYSIIIGKWEGGEWTYLPARRNYSATSNGAAHHDQASAMERG